MIDRATSVVSCPSRARVLVDVDVSLPLPSRLRINLPNGKSLWQKIMYENRSEFCSFCSLRGHATKNCLQVQHNQTQKGKEKMAEEAHGSSVPPIVGIRAIEQLAVGPIAVADVRIQWKLFLRGLPPPRRVFISCRIRLGMLWVGHRLWEKARRLL
ncbi:putative serine/threonine-protein kinase fhkD [Iris pallida]|uniref:Serine/threonine-protein kinase fhkD n=1 Tax=Iris pallida TaxID=29817 RepID=A0AAX6DZX2_IRIPA|nr:putative serine/threonine-protein kinase fhkD [Iris pallida]